MKLLNSTRNQTGVLEREGQKELLSLYRGEKNFEKKLKTTAAVKSPNPGPRFLKRYVTRQYVRSRASKKLDGLFWLD